MTALANAWRWATEQRTVSVGICAAVVAAGVLLIAVGEIADWGWTRLIGAGVVSLGAVLAGVLIGWSDPIRPRFAATLRRWSRAIVLVLAAIIVLPVLVGQVIAFGGLLAGDIEAGTGLVVTGIVVILLLLGVTAGTAWVALGAALRSVSGTASEQHDATNGATDGQEAP